MNTVFLTAALLGALALSGCSDCSRDPSQARGLGCATGNLVGGVYTEDDAKIEREIAALEARHEALLAEADRLKARANSLSGERRAAAQRLAALNAETARMNARLSELNERASAPRDNVAALRAREARLSREVLAADENSVSQAEINRLSAERANLEADIDRLLAVS